MGPCCRAFTKRKAHLGNSVKVKVKFPEAHSKKQQLIMNAFNTKGLKKLYVSCGTKFGKSISASVCMSNVLLNRPRTKWRWIAPIYDQARIGMEYFRGMLPPEPHSKFHDGKMYIDLPKIQSKIEFWHCKDPKSMEGGGINGHIFDEAAKCPYAAYVSAGTTLTFTGGPEMFISTPFGKNHFYKGAMEAKEHMEWAFKTGKTPEQAFITASTLDNPYIDPAVVERAKGSLSHRLFQQYYMAEFLDDGSTFVGFRDCVEGDPLDDLYGATQYWIHPDALKHDVVIGVDWAKKQDYTVFTALSSGAGVPKMLGFMRFQGIGYVEALGELYKFIKKFKNIILVKHDRTGVGEAIDDMLGQFDFPFEGLVFTNQSKSAMVNQLMLTFETKGIILANWPDMLKELESYEVTTSDSGNFKYSAPTGMHDDIVSSLMLANSAIQEYASDFKLQFLEDLPDSKLSVDKWYTDLKMDSDDSPF